MASTLQGDAEKVFKDCYSTVLNVTDNTTTVYTGKCLFLGYYVSTVLSAHVNVFQDCYSTVLNVTDNTTTVYTGKCLFLGYYVNTTCGADVNVFQDNATAIISLPASIAAGSNFVPPYGVRCETSLVWNPADAATSGSITVFWRPL